MDLTDIRVFLKEGQDKKLKAYVTITFDNVFVVRNVKVIQGPSGLFIAMPSRKARISCRTCGYKNEVGSKFCSECGEKVPPLNAEDISQSETKSDHRDIAHPITQEFRDQLERKVLEAFSKEIKAQKGVGEHI